MAPKHRCRELALLASLLFTILIATIFLPYAVTIIPTYTVFLKLGWVGTWLPLLVPTLVLREVCAFLQQHAEAGVPASVATFGLPGAL